MSSVKDINLLLKIFGENCLKTTFEAISHTFGTLEKCTYFHTGTTIVLFLKSKDILNNQPKYLIAYFLLWELGMHESDSNPFLELIHSALTLNDPKLNFTKCPPLDQIGRTFLASIILQTHSAKENLKKTPYTVYQEGVVVNDVDLSGLVKMINDNNSNLPYHVRSGISCIIPFEDTSLFKPEPKNPDESRVVLETLLLGENAPVRRSLRPEFLRLPPPLHGSGTLDELVWVGPPAVDHPLAWDLSDGRDCSEEYVLNLLKSAKNSQLMPNQCSQLQAKLKENPELLRKIEFKPSELPGMVDKNPAVAFEALLIVFETPEVVSYLKELLEMEVSLHSLEVVNQLTSSVEVPTQFIQRYIERCIRSCHDSNDRMMHRLVRLVCVFLQSLIRNRIIEVKEIQNHVNNFCIQFNSIREANALFKLMKSVNGSAENE